jgi:hypothetical protein
MTTCSTNFCTLDLRTSAPKSYVVNNGWDIGSATGSQSIDVTSQTAWSTTFDWTRAAEFSVTSYAAAIVGWHSGTGFFYPFAQTRLPVQLSASTVISAAGTYTYTPDAACGISRTCRYDIAFDMWVHDVANPETGGVGTLMHEVMIWTKYDQLDPNGINPVSAGTPTLGGHLWDVRESTVGGHGYTAFLINEPHLTSFAFNLSDFFDWLVAHRGMPASWWLSGVEFGIEVYKAKGVLSLSSYTLDIEAAAPAPEPPTFSESTRGLWRLEGERLPQETQGVILPEYYGDIHKDIPGYPLQVGYAALLANNCGADLDDTTLLLSGPDLDTIQEALILPVIAQIDQEWVKVNEFLADPWRIVVERGYSLTVPAIHAKGASVVFIESRPVYAFASSPPGCRYPDDAAVQLRSNEVAQTPPATIRLQDTRWVAGGQARWVTVEFDLTRMFGGVPAPPAAQTIVIDQPLVGGGYSPRRLWSAQASRTGDLRIGGMGGTTGGAAGGFGGSGGLFSGSSGFRGVSRIAPPAAPPPAVPTAPTARATSGPIRIFSSPLGRVTMDLKGLIDTPAGRYTGTPSAPLLEPAPIVQCLLETTFGETRRHIPTWTATRALQAALTMGGLTWRVAWRGMDFETFRTTAGYCGLADLWLDDDGRWRYTGRNRLAEPVATLTPREILGDVAVGFIPPSATKLAVTWGAGLQAGSFTRDSPDMLPRYGVITDRTLDLPWVSRGPAARAVAREWGRQWDRDRWIATVAVAPSLAALTRTDRVLLDTFLLDLYGPQRVPWEIRGTTDRGDQRILTLVECDALATREIGQALETDLAQPLTVVGGVSFATVAQTTETDLARGIVAQHGLTGMIGQATSSHLAQTITASQDNQTVALGQVTEADLAQTITRRLASIVAVGPATETDQAQALTAVLGSPFAHGAVKWLAASTVGTVYTVSGLSFQPKALRFYAMGLDTLADNFNGSVDMRASLGFATGPADRRCVASRDNAAVAPTVVSSAYRDDCVALAITSSSGAIDGLLDLNTITSDGFTLIVDDQLSADLVLFWEAFGGALTVAQTLEIAEPAATGDQDYTVTGFTSGGTDQVVLFAGSESTAASPTASRTDQVIMVGAARGSGSQQWVAFQGTRDAMTVGNPTSRGYGLSGECLANKTLTAGQVSARASWTQWNTNGFRLNWAERANTGRKYIALALKGGSWAVGETTLAVGTGGATTTISGLGFAPIGVALVSIFDVESTSDTTIIPGRLSLGTGSSPSARRAMYVQANDSGSTAQIRLAIEYDSILVATDTSGITNRTIDLNAMSAGGFQLIVDTAAGATTIWIGYVTFRL